MISTGFVEEALDVVRRHGLATEPLLASAGLPPVVTDAVSAERYGALWIAIANALEDEFLGLGRRPLRPGGFTLLCHCVLHATTLEQALRRALRFLSVTLEEPRGLLERVDGMAEIRLMEDGPAHPAFTYRTYWIILHGLACWLVGRRIPVQRIDFRCTAPDREADYRLFFGAPVHFAQPVSRLTFDAAYLTLPLLRTEPMLKRFLRAAPANILVRYRYDHGLTSKVREHLRRTPPAHWPDLAEMARRLRMPAAALRRRLQEETQSFRGIKDEIRRALALDWLMNSGRTVGEISADLGFAEPSAFHRAFRKWTDQSPGAFRVHAAPAPNGETKDRNLDGA